MAGFHGVRPVARARGLQSEILLSLAVVMATATGVLAATLARAHAAASERLARLAAQALVAEARSPLSAAGPGTGGARWWTVDAEGRAAPRGDHAEALDADSLTLAARARATGDALVSAGAAWQPPRVAVPLGAGGSVAVARLPAAAARGPVLALLAGDVLVFTAFGAFLLRRRLVLPLQRLAAAARAIEQGEPGVRAAVAGPAETAEVASAFNAMTAALARRSEALEKAVADLRASNLRLREARAGLDRAERLASVGRLAAGVAHELGNPMGALLAFLDLARREPGLPPPAHGFLERAAREGERVRAILRQLLDFSRPPRRARSPVDVARVCEETAGLVRAQRRYAGIAIEVVREGEPPPALADPDALAQIVLNLLLNAADALRESGTPAPRVRVRVRGVVERWRAGEGPEAAAARRRVEAVECWVADNGPGIAEEDRERIFDPFFTTKPPGEGTGLGLSNAARFAEELGGSLSVGESEPPASEAAAQRGEAEGSAREGCRHAGRGAVFVLRLPASVGEPGGTPRGALAGGDPQRAA
jgi:signal transduction histidine kinase